MSKIADYLKHRAQAEAEAQAQAEAELEEKQELAEAAKILLGVEE